MVAGIDDKFYARADAHIRLANEHCEEIAKGKVSASFMYALARYNAWVSASGFSSGEDMKAAMAETVEYFTNQYRAMLEENLNDYSENFDGYMKSGVH